MINKIMRRLTGRQIALFISGVISVLIGLVIMGCGLRTVSGLEDQNMAERWSDEKDVAQVSCFFSREAGISEDSILSFEYNLTKALEEASIVSTSENESARLWADAYSASGKVYIESDRAGLELSAVGIGGDFFLFHPLKLETGSYFSGSDLMQDYVILDEDAAWQLFGSNDIVGQIVYISKIPHLVAGVVERPEGRMEDAAGLSSSIVYVSYETLSKYGTDYGINTYELVMPNPVSGYAKTYVMENIGVSENEVEVVENTSRYELIPLFKQLAQFGTRSMSSKAIIYPYWENIARGYEDILMLLLLIAVLFFLYPTVLLVVALRCAWKRRTWTAKSLWHKFTDKVERLREKHWAKSKARKEKKAQRESGESGKEKPKKPKEPKKTKEPKKLKKTRKQKGNVEMEESPAQEPKVEAGSEVWENEEENDEKVE